MYAMITKKEHLINYFQSGIKDTNNFKIGIEHEKFIFDLNINKTSNLFSH